MSGLTHTERESLAELLPDVDETDRRRAANEVLVAVEALVQQAAQREVGHALAQVRATLPEECWVTQTPLARCTDLIGAKFDTGATWVEDMCCLPCRVRFTTWRIEEARDG